MHNKYSGYSFIPGYSCIPGYSYTLGYSYTPGYPYTPSYSYTAGYSYIHGYSYIQAICVLGIMLIITTAAIPSFRQLLSYYKMRTALILIQQIVRSAQHTAIHGNTAVIIQVNNNTQHEVVAIKNNAIVKKIAFPQLDDLTWHGFGSSKQLIIMPNGFTFNNGHFRVQMRAKSCDLIINNALKSSLSCYSE